LQSSLHDLLLVLCPRNKLPKYRPLKSRFARFRDYFGEIGFIALNQKNSGLVALREC